jgi:hypothetical protein
VHFACTVAGMDCTSPLGCHLERIIESMDSPTGIEIAAFIVAMLGVIASSFLGWVAWRTSEKAKDAAADATAIAKQAFDAELSRDAALQTRELSQSLVELFVAIGEYVAALSLWAAELADLEMRHPGVDPDELLDGHRPQPSPSGVTVQLEVALLRASGDDVQSLEKIAELVAEIMKLKAWERGEWLQKLITGIRKWRNGTWKSRAGFHGFLNDRAREVKTRVRRRASRR